MSTKIEKLKILKKKKKTTLHLETTFLYLHEDVIKSTP